MKAYNEKGKEVELYLPYSSLIGQGGFANVYRINDTVYKHFHRSYQSYGEILEVLTKIRSLNLDNMYEIKNFYFDDEGKLLVYSTPYYKSINKAHIIDMSPSYLIENYRNLLTLAKNLAKEGIIIDDLHDKNVIMTSDKAIIIDADLYGLIPGKDKYLMNSNLERVTALAKAILQESVLPLDYQDYPEIRLRVAEAFEMATERRLLKYSSFREYMQEEDILDCKRLLK